LLSTANITPSASLNPNVVVANVVGAGDKKNTRSAAAARNSTGRKDGMKPEKK
jgi:hypothetical protein